MKNRFFKLRATALLLLALILAVTLSSCGQLVRRDDLANIYGGTAVVDGEKIWLGEEFDTFGLYHTELTSVSDQTAFRTELGSKTLYYVNVGAVKHYPVVYDSASTLYGADYKVSIKYKWGEREVVDISNASRLDPFLTKDSVTYNGTEVKYSSDIELSDAAFSAEAAARGLTDTESAEKAAINIYDNEANQKRELVAHTAPGYYKYTVCVDFEIYAVFSYDPVRDSASYTYVFFPVEDSITGLYARGDREDFIRNTGSYQLITLDAYRLSQLLVEVFDGSDATPDGDVTDGDSPSDSPDEIGKTVASYTFSDTQKKEIFEAGSFGLGLGSVRDLIDLSEYAEYLNGEHELRFTVEATVEFGKLFAIKPIFCVREYCLYDRMPPPEGITGIVSESTAHDEYGMVVCGKKTPESLFDVKDSFAWTLDGDAASEKMYLVYNAAEIAGNHGDPEWTLCTVSVRVEIVKK